jgi:predicted O-linked N-acetylglucosamine transferase (SPINDLY family)
MRQAQSFARRGETQKARQLYQAILEARPDNIEARDALAALESRSARFNTLSTYLQKDEFAAVVEQGEALLPEYPDAVFLCNLLGTAYANLHQPERAISYFEKALEIRPDIAEAHANLGKALSETGRGEDAIASFLRALRIRPDYADAHYSLGVALGAASRPGEAITCFTRALQIRPDFTEARNNLGLVLGEAGRHEEAIACFKTALRANQDVAGAHLNLGILYNRLARYPEAIASLTAALKIDPGLADARAQKLFLQATICDWNAIAEEAGTISILGVSGGAVQPFTMLPFEDNPAHHQARSENFATERCALPEPEPIAVPATRPARLRIGYFSADFHGHAVMHQLIRALELHDRARFEVHAYSFGPPVDDAMQARVRAAVDVFHDVRALGPRDIAALARGDGIDVAIDLMGYTRNARPEIFAHRAAPVQISYLGYPGTLGASFMDYLIADRILIPEESRRHYSEKIIYLPHGHMATDNTKAMAERPITRAEMGLPERGFVFCCFNNSYKISPAEFDVWMRLLMQVEGSVLWLVRTNSWAQQNLRAEAMKRDINPDRIIFAERVPMPDHLARHRLADLFLDTFTYNGHSTAADALWAGLPVVTRLGQGFAARVAASLLNAVGLSELVAVSTEDYERLALTLANNPQRLAALKARLQERKLRAPLFDSEGFVRHIENAYCQAYECYFNGEQLDVIEVAAD